jgi:hypothetical protein
MCRHPVRVGQHFLERDLRMQVPKAAKDNAPQIIDPLLRLTEVIEAT